VRYLPRARTCRRRANPRGSGAFGAPDLVRKNAPTGIPELGDHERRARTGGGPARVASAGGSTERAGGCHTTPAARRPGVARPGDPGRAGPPAGPGSRGRGGDQHLPRDGGESLRIDAQSTDRANRGPFAPLGHGGHDMSPQPSTWRRCGAQVVGALERGLHGRCRSKRAAGGRGQSAPGGRRARSRQRRPARRRADARSLPPARPGRSRPARRQRAPCHREGRGHRAGGARRRIAATMRG
jgi:hypothetical protein